MCAGSGACRTILDAEGNPDGGATGLAACEALCDSQSNCNLINFVPFGATGASGVGRCCPRACTDDEMSTEYSIVADRGGWDIYAVGVVHGYDFMLATCNNGGNYNLLRDQTADTCAVICSNDSSCKSFELYASHGGDRTILGHPMGPGDCYLQYGADHSGCDGTHWNVDLYIKQDPAPGGNVLAKYFDVGTSSVLPDFTTLPAPDVTETIDTIYYPSTQESWVGPLYRNTVAAEYTGCINIYITGTYTFMTNSDDGSKLYVDDQLVVNNDGLHGMQTRQGTIDLTAGMKISVKVDFFENAGGKGIIVSWQPPGAAVATIPANAWRECEETPSGPSPPSGQGDPHIKTWVGEKYDFHGVCDLVMLSNPGFDNGRGMHIHIRNKRTRVWSYISTAAVSIGEEILQVAGGTNSNKYFLNGREQDADSNNSDGVLEDFAGYELKYQRISDNSVEYEIVLKNRDSIVFKTWNGLVSVKVNYPQKEDFDGSLGLFGSYPTGVKLARDNETIISDSNMFGQEWQVIDTEPKLFKESEGPQFPTKCDIPNSIDMRRRLANSGMTMEMANTACALVAEDDKDLCIFDVLATNNIESAGAY
jgi:hypothetical protein